jgi:hypothetical protein
VLVGSVATVCSKAPDGHAIDVTTEDPRSVTRAAHEAWNPARPVEPPSKCPSRDKAAPERIA